MANDLRALSLGHQQYHLDQADRHLRVRKLVDYLEQNSKSLFVVVDKHGSQKVVFLSQVLAESTTKDMNLHEADKNAYRVQEMTLDQVSYEVLFFSVKKSKESLPH